MPVNSGIFPISRESNHSSWVKYDFKQYLFGLINSSLIDSLGVILSSKPLQIGVFFFVN